jgi:hypothetical protein
MEPDSEEEEEEEEEEEQEIHVHATQGTPRLARPDRRDSETFDSEDDEEEEEAAEVLAPCSLDSEDPADLETMRLNPDGSVPTLLVGDDEEDAEAREEEEEEEEEVQNDASRSDGARNGWLWRQKEEPELYSEETPEDAPAAKRFIAEMGTLHFEQVKAGQIVPAGELAYVLPGAYAHLAKHQQRRVSGQSVIVTRALGSEEEEVHVKSAIELTNGRPDPSCKVARANVWVKVYAEDLDDAIEGSRRVSDRAKKGPAPAFSPEGRIDKKRSMVNRDFQLLVDFT